MTKKSFAFLVLAVASGLLFALGMCMCLLPEWDAFGPGVVVTALGALALLVLAGVCWVSAGKPMVKVDRKKMGKVIYSVLALLVLGTGMALIMAFEGMLIPGIIVGVIGIVLVLGMIPVFVGLK